MSTLLERVRTALAPHYEVERMLGAGGMGVVFLARDTRLDRQVAIKVLRPEVATAVAVERFSREAKTLARLHHPSVVRVFHAGDAAGISYYVMEYLGATRSGAAWSAAHSPLGRYALSDGRCSTP